MKLLLGSSFPEYPGGFTAETVSSQFKALRRRALAQIKRDEARAVAQRAEEAFAAANRAASEAAVLRRSLDSARDENALNAPAAEATVRISSGFLRASLTFRPCVCKPDSRR